MLLTKYFKFSNGVSRHYLPLSLNSTPFLHISYFSEFSTKPRPGSIAAKQFEKKMGMALKNVEEVDEIPEHFDKREVH
jgi:hypothetical protein